MGTCVKTLFLVVATGQNVTSPYRSDTRELPQGCAKKIILRFKRQLHFTSRRSLSFQAIWIATLCSGACLGNETTSLKGQKGRAIDPAPSEKRGYGLVK
jgi:hypothetical protein